MSQPVLLSNGELVTDSGAPVPSSALGGVAALSDELGVTRTDWTAPTLGNSWVDFGGGYEVARYRKVGDVVQLDGLIKEGASATSPFTLPAGFRPTATQVGVVFMAGGVGGIVVDAAGVVTVTEFTGTAITSTSLKFSFSTL